MSPPSSNHEVFSVYTGTGDETTRTSSSLLKNRNKLKYARKWVFAAEKGAVLDWIGRLVRCRELARESIKEELLKPEEEVGISGWLWKRNKGRQWKKRFFKQV